MKLRIVRVAGQDVSAEAGQRILDKGSLTLGRGADCDWTLPDPDRTLSKRHCEVRFQGNVYVLRDTSTNGVFLNNAKVPIGRGKSAVLGHGDVFRAAGFEFRAEMVGHGDAPGAVDGTRSFADPGSPLDRGGIGALEGDSFDPFSTPSGSSGTDSLFPDAASDDWETDWASAEAASAELHSGLGVVDFQAPPDTPIAEIPDAFEGFISTPPTDDPWSAPEPSAQAVPGQSDTAELAKRHASVLLEALISLDSLQDAAARRIGLTLGPSAITGLPDASGLTLIDQLATMDGDAGERKLDEICRDFIAREEMIVQALQLEPAGQQQTGPDGAPDRPASDESSATERKDEEWEGARSGSGESPRNGSPFDEEPFS